MSTAAFARRAVEKWIADDEAIAAHEHWHHADMLTFEAGLEPERRRECGR